MEFKRANEMKAAVLFFVDRKKFLVLASRHSIAINLAAKDLRASFERGTYPPAGWEVEAINFDRECAIHLQRKLFVSFLWILASSLVAITVGFMIGSMNAKLTISISKLITFTGTALASWATLFELGGGIATFSGKALHELIHPKIFQFIFIPGVLLLLTGIVL